MDWIQQWQSKLNKQNEVAPLVRTGGSRHTGLAALPYRNIHQKSARLVLQAVTAIARSNANSLCRGLLYEPKVPTQLKK